MSRKVFFLVDDDSDDTGLFGEALKGLEEAVVCHSASNGREALRMLDELAERGGSAQLPNVIFLDINMPVMNGWECLKRLKENEAYHPIPVIMYSTSSQQREVDKAMDLGALCFFSKPTDFDELVNVLSVVAANLNENLAKSIAHFPDVLPKDRFAYLDQNE